jgi:hypothetical protein
MEAHEFNGSTWVRREARLTCVLRDPIPYSLARPDTLDAIPYTLNDIMSHKSQELREPRAQQLRSPELREQRALQHEAAPQHKGIDRRVGEEQDLRGERRA